MGGIQKMIWAVDVLGELEPQTRILAFLKRFAMGKNISIEPLYVLRPGRNRSEAGEVSKEEEASLSLAEKALAGLTRASESPALGRGTVLLGPDRSKRGCIRGLIDYALVKEVDAIVVSTHSRKGFDRLVLGSFAETLLLQSKVPLLTVNPRAKTPRPILKILFPTDLGQASRRGFEATVGVARQFGAAVILFHQAPPLSVPPDFDARKERAIAWKKWAEDRGVATDLRIEALPGDVATAIVESATLWDVDLISMVVESGPLARQVVRTAGVPVWVRQA